MFKFQAMYTAGFVMGPALNIMFLDINLNIGQWHVNKYNSIGLFLGIILVIYNTFVYFGLEDLSRKQGDMFADEISGPKTSDEPSKVSLGKLLTSHWIMLIILSSSMVNYTGVITELILPIISKEHFQWNIERLSIITTISVAIFAVFMLALGTCLINARRRVYLLYLACLVVLCCSLLLLILPELIHFKSIMMQTIIFSSIMLMNSIAGLVFITIAKTIYLILVPSSLAGFYEGIRGLFYRGFGLVAFFSASLIAPYLIVVIPIFILILIVFFVLYCYQYKYFMSILIPTGMY